MRFPLLLGTAALAALLPACSEPTGAVAPPATAAAREAATAAPPPARTSALRKVDPDQVCMMNNRFMGTAQIPVEVGGKTYFGCCAMCKDRLNADPAARTAKDPVTGKDVDKAAAVIGVRPDKTVVYFESQATFDAYSGT